MPYKIIKLNNRCYQVINSQTGQIHAKCTTLKNAKAQMRLLYGIENGYNYGGYLDPFPVRNKYLFGII